MFKRTSFYKNKKYASEFVASYRQEGSDRVFVLSGKVSGQNRNIVYSSPVAAMQDGWVRLRIERKKNK